MALQHFYSRVPFRMSMFNKADSFDTFACSAGLDHEFIEKELAAPCERRPTVEESDKIRENKLLPVYYSYTAKTGELVQSCTTYIPSDYTGERSSYMVHSLVYSEEEKQSLIGDPEAAAVNEELFVHSIDYFHITDPEAVPDDSYPEKAVQPAKIDGFASLLENYDEKMLRCLIFSLLDSVCGKTKAVFISLPGEESTEKILQFYNTVLQLFPYHIREKLSFVSGVADANMLPGFKVKFIRTDAVDEVPISKGTWLRFQNNLVSGLKEESFKAQTHIISFFMELLTKEPVRREFLWFAKETVQRCPALGAFTAQALRDLIFLFCVGSDFYDQKTVLPNDDAVLSFYNAYDKTREALWDEYRIHAAKCLQRYPQQHMEIPKKVFAKVSKLYPSEPDCVKHIIMDVVLELIHTDIMRNKLYTFIKGQYGKEDEKTQAVILENLSRVYYGGFLQSQILSFFSECFPQMSDESKNVVLDKMLLTLRTKAVQNDILAFLNQHFEALTPDNRQAVYKAAVEHMTEGDDLAVRLMGFVDDHIESEEETVRAAFLAGFLEAIESEQKKGKHPMIKAVCKTGGFCNTAVIFRLLTAWHGRKIFPEYVALSCAYSVGGFIRGCVMALTQLPDTPVEVYTKLEKAVLDLGAENRKDSSIFETLDFIQALADVEKRTDNSLLAEFVDHMLQSIILPTAENSLLVIFQHPEVANAAETAAAQAKGVPSLRACEQYRQVAVYLQMKKAAAQNRPEDFLTAYGTLSMEDGWKRSLGRYMQQDLLQSGLVKAQPMCGLVDFVSCQLRRAKFSFSAVYEKAVELMSEAEPEAKEETDKPAPKKKAKTDDGLDAKSKALGQVLAIGYAVFRWGDGPLKESMWEEGCDFGEVLTAFLADFKKTGSSAYKQQLHSLTPACDAFNRYCDGLLVQKNKEKGGGLFSRLFRR